MGDPFDLSRFVDAQVGSYATALREIQQGRKRGHWMWFIFPQLAGLGRSPMAQRYAISSLDEARAFLDHPLLGPRYDACVQALQALSDAAPETVFGTIDAVKLRSSLTLFGQIGHDELFSEVLDRWFAGEDVTTLRLLEG